MPRHKQQRTNFILKYELGYLRWLYHANIRPNTRAWGRRTIKLVQQYATKQKIK